MVDLRDEAVEKGEIDGAGGFDESGELFANILFVGEFGVGDDVDVGIFSEDLKEKLEIDGVVLVLPERGHEVGVGEVGRRYVRGADFGVVLDSGGVFPVVGVVSGDGFVVIGQEEVDFEDAMTEAIIQEECFVRISVGIAENAAEGVGDVGVIVGPAVVEAVGRFGARDVGCFWGGVLGGVIVVGYEENSSNHSED